MADGCQRGSRAGLFSQRDRKVTIYIKNHFAAYISPTFDPEISGKMVCPEFLLRYDVDVNGKLSPWL